MEKGQKKTGKRRKTKLRMLIMAVTMAETMGCVHRSFWLSISTWGEFGIASSGSGV